MSSVIKTALMTLTLSLTSGILLDKYKNFAPKILCALKKVRMSENNGANKCYILTIKNISKKTIKDLNINIQGEFNDLKIDDAKITNGLKFSLSNRDNVYDVSIPFLSRDEEFLVNLYVENSSGQPIVTLRSPQKFKEVNSEESAGFIASIKDKFISKKQNNNSHDDEYDDEYYEEDDSYDEEYYDYLDDTGVIDRTEIRERAKKNESINEADEDNDIEATQFLNSAEIASALENEQSGSTQSIDETQMLNTEEIAKASQNIDETQILSAEEIEAYAQNQNIDETVMMNAEEIAEAAKNAEKSNNSDSAIIVDSAGKSTTHTITEDDLDDDEDFDDDYGNTGVFDRREIRNKSEDYYTRNTGNSQYEDATGRIDRNEISHRAGNISSNESEEDSFNYDMYAEREENTETIRRTERIAPRRSNNSSSNSKRKRKKAKKSNGKKIIAACFVIIIALLGILVVTAMNSGSTNNKPVENENKIENIQEPIENSDDDDIEIKSNKNSNSTGKTNSTTQTNTKPSVNQSSNTKKEEEAEEEEEETESENESSTTNNKENNTTDSNQEVNTDNNSNNNQSTENNSDDKTQSNTNSQENTNSNSQTQNNQSSNSNASNTQNSNRRPNRTESSKTN